MRRRECCAPFYEFNMAAFTPSAFYGKACDSSDSECDFSGEDTYDPKEASEIVSESTESDGDSTESDEETCTDAVASSSWTPYLDSDQDFETHLFTVQNPDFTVQNPLASLLHKLILT
ncbi:unnamed protein product [Ixodes persulcatus]